MHINSAKVDFNGILAFYAIYQIQKTFTGPGKIGFLEIVDQMKSIAKPYSVELHNVDRRNVPFIISGLYAQGIINHKRKITVADLKSFCFIVNDMGMEVLDHTCVAVLKKIAAKQHIIRLCLNEMGCLGTSTIVQSGQNWLYIP